MIAIDWGTSNLRASLLDTDGSEIELRSARGGVMSIKDGQFADALASLCGDWMVQLHCPMIASGMIGSRQGWKEAPYIGCPATVGQAAAALVGIDFSFTGATAAKHTLHIVPGLQCLDDGQEFDVMRGEETQIWGAGVPANSGCVLPGTHSKWAWTGEDGEVKTFRTYLTGELYALLTQHGILGRLMEFGDSGGIRDIDAYTKGVHWGLQGHAQVTHAIFAARTAGLMGRIAPRGLPDYLSGILIGAEIASAARLMAGTHSVTLIGDDDLCERYRVALSIHGLSSTRAPAGSTTQGQWTVARKAGLVPSTP
ncbi:MAG: 2-dehydro-3-deoxygalactonokinase [Rhodoferax sp.]|nr:2-dehydro-3-deoxygalactonokinase [Rhodoferax sp.]